MHSIIRTFLHLHNVSFWMSKLFFFDLEMLKHTQFIPYMAMNFFVIFFLWSIYILLTYVHHIYILYPISVFFLCITYLLCVRCVSFLNYSIFILIIYHKKWLFCFFFYFHSLKSYYFFFHSYGMLKFHHHHHTNHQS